MTRKLLFPKGSYELRDIEKYLKRAILQSYSDHVARKKTQRDQ